MAGLPSRDWRDLTTTDFEAMDTLGTVVLQPVAAIEQHGPHLPLSVDAVINEGIVAAAMARLATDLPVLALPPVVTGVSPEHRDFPGTISIEPETMLRLLVEIGSSVARAGLRKLVLFNSHGGQPQVMDLVAQRLRSRLGLLVVAVDAYRLWHAGGMFPERELDHGIHAGAIETSIMLHLRPDLVRHGAVAEFPSVAKGLEADYRWLGPRGPAGFAWQAQDLNPAGAVGDARLAAAEHGQALVQQAAASLAEILGEVSRAPLDLLRERN